LLEFLLNKILFFALKRFFLFVSLFHLSVKLYCLNLLRRYPFLERLN